MNTIPSILATALTAALFAGGANAAVIYNFSGTDEGGTGSAVMSTDIVGSTLTVELDNTSPTRLDADPEAGNTPGIVGFGFNLDPDELQLQTWTLQAFTSENVLVTIGSSDPNGWDWIMGTSQAGVTLDYLPQTESGVDGALFNPAVLGDPIAAALLPGGQNAVYFTTAFLEMNFNVAPSLDDSDPFSPFVRMQNVGAGGEGSLRLPGIPDDDNGGPIIEIPEPGPLALLGLGLLALFGFRRRSTV